MASSDQIRSWLDMGGCLSGFRYNSEVGGLQHILLEIAAQLAELNENLRKARDKNDR